MRYVGRVHLIFIRYQMIYLLLLIGIFICITIGIILPLLHLLRVFALIILLICSTFSIFQLVIDIFLILVFLLIIILLQLIKFHLHVSLIINIVIHHHRIRKLSVVNNIFVLLIEIFFEPKK